MSELRDLAPTHPVFGSEYRKLLQDDIIRIGDETGCVSTLLRQQPEHWRKIVDGTWVGVTVKIAQEEQGDIDGRERVFRRRVET